MKKRNLVAVAAVLSLTGAALLAQQSGPPGLRGPGGPGGPGGQRGPGGGLPAYYTSKSAPLGTADTSAAARACNATGYTRLLCLAEFSKKDLGPELLARMQLPYSVADAQRWSNFPPMGYRNRVGVTLAELSPAQLGAVKLLLKEAAGATAGEGYDEIEQILNADDYLKNNTGENGFASGNFQVAFLGTPAAQGTWQLYFGGHHLAFSNTYRDGRLVGATPSFRGVEPFTSFRENGRDNAPLAQEQGAFAALLAGLTPAQQAKAKLSQTYTDIIVGPQRDNSFPATRAGLCAAELKEPQRQLLMRAIETYVGDVDPPDAAAILAKYRGQLAATCVAFSGTTGMNAENDYVRIDGPAVWIELSMQPGRSLPGVHPHSVWRDRGADYGGNQ